ncbi:MAG: hypothetical protein EOP13_01100 [Pseudomonas sp.]|uniref:hypothetical protein n=1 Tax=Pseudomonas sp. TaxID=306 RepID=UPI0011FB13B0|nr:hypothetical protein [Pseudomonas sp.]RZI76695.1 MAG: hypothetical protein EOP13_01100 [Pseudomonas sp.]
MSEQDSTDTQQGVNPVSTKEGPGAAPEGGSKPGAQHTGDEGGGLVKQPDDTSAPPGGQQGSGADREPDGTTGQPASSD